VSLGGGIFLIVVGAILAFALNVNVGWIDLHMVGYICLIAGIIITILGIILLTRKRTSRVTRSTTIDPNTGQQVDTTRRDDPNVY
jgi:membrane-bound ClpP family serine protease